MKAFRCMFAWLSALAWSAALLALVSFTQSSTLNAQPIAPSSAPAPDAIRGKLRRFDQSPHVAVPVQLLDRSNQVVQTQLSDAAGSYSFTDVAPGAYRIRCHVLGGFRLRRSQENGFDKVWRVCGSKKLDNCALNHFTGGHGQAFASARSRGTTCPQ